MRLGRVLVACVAISCSGAQRTGPAKSTNELAVKTYAPLGMKADATLPDRAVLLGTDDRDGSTLIALPATTAPVQLGIVELATTPASDGSGLVVLPDTADAAWRAGVWIAAHVAAAALDKDLGDFTFSATPAGPADGTSALVAAGFLASITGTSIDPSVAIIGTIQPDGSIGPVVGLPEKLSAAIQAGKKRIGFPAGLRHAVSTSRNRPLDVIALAKDRGAEAVEVADVHQAFALLTGSQLPAPVPASEADMAFDEATSIVLEGKYKQWQQRLATEWGAILLLESAGRVPATLAYLRDHSKRNAEAAEALHKRGKRGVAYARMLLASIYATSANQVYEVLAKVQANKIDDALAILAALDTLDAATKDAFATVGARQPTTIGGHLQVLAAFRPALRAWVYKGFAASALASTTAYVKSLAGTDAAALGSEKIAEEVVARVAPAILYIAKTLAETTLATEQLDFASSPDVEYTASIADVRRGAASLSAASLAAMQHVDTLLVEPLATAEKLSSDDARVRVAAQEPDYLVAHTLSRWSSLDGLPRELAQTWGDSSLPWALLSLAGGELAYASAAELIARYGVLGVSLAKLPAVDSVRHHKAFATLLASAERRARIHARAARIATGTIPVQAKLAYQLARVERDGTLAEKLDALAQFWASSAYSQTAVMLARN